MNDKVFSEGALRTWNDLTRYVTGQEFTANACAAEFKH